MEILEGLDGLRQVGAGAVLSIGNFDGVHLGHQRILQTGRALAATAGGSLAVVTFEPHPVTVLRPQLAPPRLTPRPMKEALLEAQGVQKLVVLPPTPEVLNLTAERFWQILRDQVRPSHIVEGSSFNFGRGRQGTIDRLREWAAASEIQLHVVESVQVPLLDLSVVPVSSSLVRWLLAYGRVRDGAICLGRAYRLAGRVIKGHGRGRGIGVPTANLQCQQLVPMDGVYAGRCTVAGETYPAAVSIGTMPTFGEHARQVEAHLIGFDGELYGQVLEVDLVDWLREQVKFGSIEALKIQLKRDIESTIARCVRNPARPIAMAG